MIPHFVLPGETLESISEEIQLENPQYLKEYHNQHCARQERIEEELIPGHRLIMPGIDKVREFNNRNDAPFKSLEKNPVLKFNPENLHTQYKVEIKENQQGEGIKNVSQTISYTVTLQWYEANKQEHLFHCTREGFVSNEGKMGNLARKCVEVLNPLLIKTDLKGEILNVALRPEILENFRETKRDLLDKFPDQYAERYIEELEYVINNAALFDERMKTDLFIKTYFGPLRSKFENGISVFSKDIGEENVSLEVIQKADKTDSGEKINLLQKANLEIPEVDYKGNYVLSSSDGIIEKAEIQYDISLYGVKYVTRIILSEVVK
ncbi:hypothetical protein [Chryseobacterium sp.]|uniref:hypothetical protein n=1 Tax=Chryseobacterium sp. TaxID=1871047 RepID=UPI0025B862EE|nr:hypothetical protein [Chryseobacterium sp.]